MVFIHGQSPVVITLYGQVLHATLADHTLFFVDDGFGSTPPLLYTTGNGGIERHAVSANGSNLPIPPHINVTHMPCPVSHTLATTKRSTVEIINPLLRRRAPQHQPGTSDG